MIGTTICVFNNYERVQQWIEPPADNHLTYNDFSEFCNKDIGKNSQETTVMADIDCSQLIGQNVQWDGYIKSSKVVSVYNPILAVLSFFPKVSFTVQKCYYLINFKYFILDYIESIDLSAG